MTKISSFNSLDALLFDFDGTLVASEMVHLACWQQVLQPFGFELHEQQYRNLCYGSTIFASARALCNFFRLELAPEELAKRKTAQLMAKLTSTPFEPMPGAESLLQALSQNGVKLALVTGSRRREVDLTLSALAWDKYFDCRVTLDDVSAGKPAPESYQLAMKKLGLKGRNCIAIEDSATGMSSALAAELPVFSVHAAKDQRDNTPDASGHYDSLREFAADVLGLDLSKDSTRCSSSEDVAKP